jgi:hypothetical protein
VLQDPLEQVEQLEDEAFSRLEPPPMPKEETAFRTSAEPHAGQAASFSRPIATRHSKRRPHFAQTNS